MFFREVIQKILIKVAHWAQPQDSGTRACFFVRATTSCLPTSTLAATLVLATKKCNLNVWLSCADGGTVCINSARLHTETATRKSMSLCVFVCTMVAVVPQEIDRGGQIGKFDTRQRLWPPNCHVITMYIWRSFRGMVHNTTVKITDQIQPQNASTGTQTLYIFIYARSLCAFGYNVEIVPREIDWRYQIGVRRLLGSTVTAGSGHQKSRASHNRRLSPRESSYKSHVRVQSGMRTLSCF